jgi:MraZ protein
MAKSKNQAPALAVNQSSLYLGHQLRGIDNGRVILPPDWRPAGAPKDFMTVFWPVYAPECVLVLPLARWDDWYQRLLAVPLNNRDAGMLERLITSSSYPRSVDTYGRMALPDGAAERLGLRTEAMLAGRMNKFEIWDPQRYEAAMTGVDLGTVAKTIDSVRV